MPIQKLQQWTSNECIAHDKFDYVYFAWHMSSKKRTNVIIKCIACAVCASAWFVWVWFAINNYKIEQFFFTLLFRSNWWVQKKTTTKIIIISSNSGLFLFFSSHSSSSSSLVRLLLHVRVWICTACVYRDMFTWNKHKNVWTIYTCFFHAFAYLRATCVCVCVFVRECIRARYICMKKNIFFCESDFICCWWSEKSEREKERKTFSYCWILFQIAQ